MSPNTWRSRCSQSVSHERWVVMTCWPPSLLVSRLDPDDDAKQGLILVTGSAISWDGHFNTQTEDEVFSSVIDLMLNCGCFVYIGAWMPFNMFNATELGITPWRLVVLFVAVLILRRFPPLLLLYKWVPEITSWREALFSGHFGVF